MGTSGSKVIISLIRCYRYFLSPFLGKNCRFIPSCSRYAEEAYKSLGFFKGTIAIIKRLARCHPLCKGGYDPVLKEGINKIYTQTERKM